MIKEKIEAFLKRFEPQRGWFWASKGSVHLLFRAGMFIHLI